MKPRFAVSDAGNERMVGRSRTTARAIRRTHMQERNRPSGARSEGRFSAIRPEPAARRLLREGSALGSVRRQDPDLSSHRIAAPFDPERVQACWGVLERENEPRATLDEGWRAVLAGSSEEFHRDGSDLLLHEPDQMNAIVQHDELDDVPHSRLDFAREDPRLGPPSTQVDPVDPNVVRDFEFGPKLGVGRRLRLRPRTSDGDPPGYGPRNECSDRSRGMEDSHVPARSNPGRGAAGQAVLPGSVQDFSTLLAGTLEHICTAMWAELE